MTSTSKYRAPSCLRYLERPILWRWLWRWCGGEMESCNNIFVPHFTRFPLQTPPARQQPIFRSELTQASFISTRSHDSRQTTTPRTIPRLFQVSASHHLQLIDFNSSTSTHGQDIESIKDVLKNAPSEQDMLAQPRSSISWENLLLRRQKDQCDYQ